ncbi:Glutathione transferase [Bertholletia excelsa]
MASLKLIGARPSPYVNRVQFALNLKSLDYEFLVEKFGTKSELLLKSNPVHKKIPVLIHDDKPICESLIIVEYIDEIWTSGPPLLPSDPYDRALARFWAAYIDDKWAPLLRELRTAQEEEEKKRVLDQMFQVLIQLEGAYRQCSKGKAFFGGDNVGYLDIALGGFLGWMKVAEKLIGVRLLDEAKTPALVGWAERFCSHDALKDAVPTAEELLEFAQKHFMAKPPTPN